MNTNTYVSRNDAKGLLRNGCFLAAWRLSERISGLAREPATETCQSGKLYRSGTAIAILLPQLPD